MTTAIQIYALIVIWMIGFVLGAGWAARIVLKRISGDDDAQH